MSLYLKAGWILSPPQTLIHSSNKYDWNLCCLSGLKRSSVSLTKWLQLFRVWDWVVVYVYFLSVTACILRL